MKKPLFVTVSFHSKPDQTGPMKELLHEIITNTLALEPGCISYNCLQSADDETLFSSLEVWQDAGAEEAHWKQAHLAKSLEKLPAMIAGEPNVRKWHRI